MGFYRAFLFAGNKFCVRTCFGPFAFAFRLWHIRDAQVFTAFAGSFVDCGFGSALIRKLTRTEADCSTVFYYNLGASILVYIILYCSAPLIAGFITSRY